MERKRIVHVLDTPYTAVGWPKVSQEDQDVILELLCHTDSPTQAKTLNDEDSSPGLAGYDSRGWYRRIPQHLGREEDHTSLCREEPAPGVTTPANTSSGH
ncbi:hypothetical protein B0T25DRAFT_566688 [Lasiosphaeria hispida]|uniref:Uncharacterized protein n=1 Tax=Lasiosphaeria hispida TaxID=260671 RepID=A0AAJ0HMB2_9PEZI|nr:hypothetical protein B0T25DRAFT_566688 [Lasiosphaeria hispida]